MAELLLETHHHDDQVHVAVIGALEHATAPQLRNELWRIINTTTPQPPHLVVDMRCCTGIDVHGLLSLVSARHVATGRDGTLVLTAVPPLIQRQVEQIPQAHCLLQE